MLLNGLHNGPYSKYQKANVVILQSCDINSNNKQNKYGNIHRMDCGPQRTDCEINLLLNFIYHMILYRSLRLIASFGMGAHKQCFVRATL